MQKIYEFLDFEKPIAELTQKIEELRQLSNSDSLNIINEIETLQTKANKMLHKAYAYLSPWQKVQVARHPQRPQFFAYLDKIFDDFIALAGDRNFGDDRSIVGGLAKFDGTTVVVMGQQKGDTTETRIEHNFGMSKPEGYRKASRLMKLADHYHLPVITFIDTKGADAGIDAEARGQGEAIASAIQACIQIQTPLLSVIIGEGFSGGAIAIGTADRVLMLEHAVYSVISPEACASIVWKDSAKSQAAATALKLTAQDLIALKIIDEIIPEPLGGAHRDPDITIDHVKQSMRKHLKELMCIPADKIRDLRRQRYLRA